MSIWKQSILAVVSVLNLAKSIGLYILLKHPLVCCRIPLTASPRSLIIFLF